MEPTPSVPAIDEPELRAAVRRILRRLDSYPGGGTAQPPVAAVVSWLAPLVQELVFDSVRFGVGLAGGSPPGSRVGAGAAGAGARSGESRSATPSAGATSRQRRRRWVDTEGLTGTLPAQGSYTPLSTPFTLAAGPFDRFTEVQTFQEALLRIPRITAVRPVSFQTGRLELSVTSQFTDAQTLVDSCTTNLAPYRPLVRGMASDHVELAIREIPETEE